MANEEKYVSGKTADAVFAQLSVKNLFVSIFLVGALSIFLGIWFSSRLFLTVIIPVGLVLLYFFSTSKVKNTDLSKSKIGDSCYFLGFSFTLVSLAAALLHLGNQEAAVNTRAIVGSFGAALATTLTGLLCRLYLTTLSSSFQSSKDKLEEEIESAMSTFSLQLQILVDEVNTGITAIGRQIGDTNLELNKSYKGQMQDNIKSISGAISNFSERLDEVEISKDMVVKPINIAMSSLIENLNKQSTDMLDMYKDIAAGTSQLSDQINKSNNLVNEYIKNFSDEFAKISEEQVSVFKNTLGGVTESFESNVSNIGNVKTNLTDSIDAELRKLKELLSSVSEITKANNETMLKTNEINQSASKVLESMSEKIPQIVVNFEKSAEPISRSSKDMDILSSSILSFKDNLSETQNILQEFNVEAVDLASKAKTTSKSIEDASGQLSKDISSIYKDLAKQIKALRETVD